MVILTKSGCHESPTSKIDSQSERVRRLRVRPKLNAIETPKRTTLRGFGILDRIGLSGGRAAAFSTRETLSSACRIRQMISGSARPSARVAAVSLNETQLAAWE